MPPSTAALAARLSTLRDQLDAELAGLADPQVVQSLVARIEPLEAALSRNRRRWTLRWSLRAGALLLLVTILLSVCRLGSAEVSLTAQTAALWFVTGETTENIVPEGPDLAAIESTSARGRQCVDGRSGPPATCRAAASIQLNALRLNPHTTAAVRTTGACVEFDILAGAAEAVITWAARTVPSNGEPFTTATLHVAPGGAITMCPTRPMQLHVVRPAEMTVANRLYLGRAERFEVPSIATATLSIPAVEGRRALGASDVVALKGLVDAAIVAHVEQQLAVSVVGRAAAIDLSGGTGTRVRDLMPTLLEWLAQSPALRWLLAIASALTWFVAGARERLLAET